MKVVVCLGNPGPRYAHTRHNAGWLFADFYAALKGFPPFLPDAKGQGDSSELGQGSERLLLFKPDRFMNRSGEASIPLVRYFRVPVSELLVVYDDKDLPFGEVRYRERGGSGGHRGMADILRLLGTEEVARIKIGVDAPPRTEHAIDTADFVLSDFSAAELALLESEVFLEAAHKLEAWLQSHS